jgi:hypothetical protein
MKSVLAEIIESESIPNEEQVPKNFQIGSIQGVRLATRMDHCPPDHASGYWKKIVGNNFF